MNGLLLTPSLGYAKLYLIVFLQFCAKGVMGSRNFNILLFVFCFTIIFSISEAIAGVMSNSLLLLEESVHMFADSISFGFNLCAEAYGGSPIADLAGAGISLLALTITLVAVVVESIKRLNDIHDHSVEINSTVMMIFGAVLCTFHLFCLHLYYSGVSVHGHGQDGHVTSIELVCENEDDESILSVGGYSHVQAAPEIGPIVSKGDELVQDGKEFRNSVSFDLTKNYSDILPAHLGRKKTRQLSFSIDPPPSLEVTNHSNCSHDASVCSEPHASHGHSHSNTEECSHHGHSHDCCGLDHTSLNMASAVFHIFIDFIHSFFVIVTGVIVRLLGPESAFGESIDAIASLILAFVIAGGVFVLGRSFFSRLRKYLFPSHSALIQRDECHGDI